MTTYRWCSGCAEETVFEQPPCLDGHGPDCPEWVCVDCGLALVIGVLVDERVIVEATAA